MEINGLVDMSKDSYFKRSFLIWNHVSEVVENADAAFFIMDNGNIYRSKMNFDDSVKFIQDQLK